MKEDFIETPAHFDTTNDSGGRHLWEKCPVYKKPFDRFTPKTHFIYSACWQSSLFSEQCSFFTSLFLSFALLMDRVVGIIQTRPTPDSYTILYKMVLTAVGLLHGG